MNFKKYVLEIFKKIIQIIFTKGKTIFFKINGVQEKSCWGCRKKHPNNFSPKQFFSLYSSTKTQPCGSRKKCKQIKGLFLPTFIGSCNTPSFILSKILSIKMFESLVMEMCFFIFWIV